MMNALPQETKDDIVVYLINNYREKLIGWIQGTSVNKGLDLNIEDIEIEK